MDETISYTLAGKYRLHQEYVTILDFAPSKDIVTEFITFKTTGELRIAAGYCWDGASGGFQTKSTMRGSLIHDALYELIALGYLHVSFRDDADAEYKKALQEDGAFKIRAGWQWLAVRVFGGAYTNKPVRPVLTAP